MNNIIAFVLIITLVIILSK